MNNSWKESRKNKCSRRIRKIRKEIVEKGNKNRIAKSKLVIIVSKNWKFLFSSIEFYERNKNYCIVTKVFITTHNIVFTKFEIPSSKSSKKGIKMDAKLKLVIIVSNNWKFLFSPQSNSIRNKNYCIVTKIFITAHDVHSPIQDSFIQ